MSFVVTETLMAVNADGVYEPEAGVAVAAMTHDSGSHSTTLATGTTDANGQVVLTLSRHVPYCLRRDGTTYIRHSSQQGQVVSGPSAIPAALTGAELQVTLTAATDAGFVVNLEGGSYTGVNVSL